MQRRQTLHFSDPVKTEVKLAQAPTLRQSTQRANLILLRTQLEQRVRQVLQGLNLIEIQVETLELRAPHEEARR